MLRSRFADEEVLSLAAIKTMVAGAEAEAKKRNVEVTIVIVDESGNLLFLEKRMRVPSTPFSFARGKRGTLPSIEAHPRVGADAVKKGNVEVSWFPGFLS